MGCVYLLTCEGSGKQYVGLTSRSIDCRFKEHIADARNRSRFPLHRAINKYGADNFKLETLAITDDRDELSRLEVEAISKFNTRAPNGYNLTGGGEAPIGDAHPNWKSEKFAAFMRANNPMANPIHRAKVTGLNHPMLGRTLSRESIERGRLKKLGRVWVHNAISKHQTQIEPEWLALYVELGWTKGRLPFFTQEARNKMSKARKGGKASAETKAKMSATRLALNDKKNGPLLASVDNLVQAGIMLKDIETLLFLTPGRAKALRRNRRR